MRNPDALGNCWFVEEVKSVANADAEIIALKDFDPSKTAVVDGSQWVVASNHWTADSTDKIEMEHQEPYNPDHLRYRSHTAGKRLAVFSEIHYAPDWRAYIDGKPAEYIRANYMLRAMVVPAGDHVIEFKNEAPRMNHLEQHHADGLHRHTAGHDRRHRTGIPEERVKKEKKQMLSVILCTYNRERYIYNVLQSIAAGGYTDYEIVLVNNNSTDGTEGECHRFEARPPRGGTALLLRTQPGVVIRPQPRHTRGAGRCAGIRGRRRAGEPRVPADLRRLLQSQQGGRGRRRPHPAAIRRLRGARLDEPLHTPARHRQADLGEKEREFPGDAFPGGGNAAYRKSVFDAVGLFNVELGRKGNSLIGAEEKDLFDKMTSRGMKFYYLPTAILYHLIPPKKLTQDYFDRLTFSIGVSERYRTLQIGKKKYLVRLVKEAVKWGGTLVLWTGFALRGQFNKGNKLIAFRKNVTQGLLRKQTTE